MQVSDCSCQFLSSRIFILPERTMQDLHCYGNRSSSIFLFQFCCQKCRLCLLEKNTSFWAGSALKKRWRGHTSFPHQGEWPCFPHTMPQNLCCITGGSLEGPGFFLFFVLSCFTDIDTQNKMDNKRGTEDRASDTKKILNVPKLRVTLLRWLVFSTLCSLENEGQTSGNHQVCNPQYSPDPSPQFLSPLLTPTHAYTFLCEAQAVETLCKREGRGENILKYTKAQYNPGLLLN